jgi:hypothetical protein
VGMSRWSIQRHGDDHQDDAEPQPVARRLPSQTGTLSSSRHDRAGLDQPSLGGSCTGVNPMGLFTPMTSPPGSTTAAFLHDPAGSDVELQASVSGRVAATAMVKRQGRPRSA